MYVDSHCHLDFPELAGRLPEVLAGMAQAQVEHALCISVTLETLPGVLALVDAHPGRLSASVGVHPGYDDVEEPDEARLVALAADWRIVAVGETGLDYYRTPAEELDWQRERFRTHIRAPSAQAGKPARAPKPAPGSAWGGVREEALLLAGLLVAAFGIWMTRLPNHLESAMWIVVLLLQAVPYLASVICALISTATAQGISRKPAQQAGKPGGERPDEPASLAGA